MINLYVKELGVRKPNKRKVVINMDNKFVAMNFARQMFPLTKYSIDYETSKK